MDHENCQQSIKGGESSLSEPLDERKLLSSRDLEGDSAMLSSDSVRDVLQRPVFTRKCLKKLRRHWNHYRSKPWNMYFFLLLGVIFAICHHLFYLILDGKPAANQSLMLRYGTIMAFCAKASLGTAASMAFQQRAWLVIRHKTARIDTVDSIFTANTDIFSLLTWSAIKKAKIGSLIAIYCWVTPLVVVLTSETLSVVVAAEEEIGKCPNVRTLNFSNEISDYWRNRVNITEPVLDSVSTYRTTAAGDTLNSSNPNEFDYWHTCSLRWHDMLAKRVAYLKQPLFREKTSDEICSNRWNCSYVLDFTAPGYKCDKLAFGTNSTMQNLGMAIPPFNTTILAPFGDRIYNAYNYIGQYTTPQIPTTTGGRPRQNPPYPKNLGAFRTEPIMWIGYSIANGNGKRPPVDRTHEDWYEAYAPVIIGCEHYEVNYTVQFRHVGGLQSHKVKNRKYLRKVIDTTLISELDPDERLNDRTKAVPQSNYIYPKDVDKYRLTAAYHSLGLSLRNILDGEIYPQGHGTSGIRITPLIDAETFLPAKNLAKEIRNLYENMIISLLAVPYLSVVSWASNGKPSSMSKGGPETAYPCKKERYINVFKYNMVQLLVVYAASIALALVAVLLGMQAYQEEGTMRDMKPSSIIAASRSSDIHELGAKGEMRIGYGLVQEAGRSVRSFGVEGNVTQPQRLETE